MKNSIIVLFLLASSILYATENPGKVTSTENTSPEKTENISWLSFTESMDLKEQGKKYFVFVYTDWCSWCKKMKSTTFMDQDVISLLNEKFVPVMFNAENKETINYKGVDFNFVPNGRRGYHELAAAMLDNRLSYPSVVFLDEKMNLIQPLPGYKSADDLKIILSFLGENIYEEMDFNTYYKQQTKGQ